MRLLVLFVALASISLEAQEGNARFRPRIGGRPAAVVVAPTVTITTPTTLSTFSTNAASIELGGLCTDDVECATVTWTNDRGGSGVASGTNPWSIPFTAAAATIFEDQFIGGGSNVDVVMHTPGPTGTSWTECIDTEAGANYVRLWNGAGVVHPNDAAVSHTLGICAAPSPSASSYDVSFKLHAFAGAIDKVSIMFGRNGATGDYCALVIRYSGENPDVGFYSVISGTPALIGSQANADPAVNDVISVEVRGTGLTAKKNGNTIISTTSTFCDDALGTGIVWGAVDGSGRVNNLMVDDFTVVDQAGGGSGISLQSGVNVLTVEGCDSVPVCGSAILTVTRGATDDVQPNLSILQPSSTGTYATSTGTLATLSGTASDNVEVTAVTWECTTTVCTPDSGSATYANGAWSVASIALAAGANTIVVTAADAAANSRTATLIVTYTASDTAAPDITVTSPSSDPYAAGTTAPLTVTGTATDNVAVTSVTWSCAAATPASGTFTPPTPGPSIDWTIALTLTGSGNCTFQARDQAANADSGSSATRTFNFTADLIITSPSTLNNATTGVAYSFQMTSSGGTGTKTWDNQAGGTALNAGGDADCNNLSISTSGLITGTSVATPPVVCSAPIRVTDSAGSPDTASGTFTINIIAAGSGPHAYFEALLLDTKIHRAVSGRPIPGTTSETSPYFQNQLKRVGGSPFWSRELANMDNLYVTYDFAGDTDAHKQDAMKMIVPAWTDAIKEAMKTLRATVSATPANVLGGCDALLLEQTAYSNAIYGNPKDFKVNNEFFSFCDPDGGGPLSWWDGTTKTLYVNRGQFGSSPAAHAIGDKVQTSSNSLSSNKQVYWPIETVDGNTYLITWDGYWTDSWLGSGLDGYKWVNLLSDGIWLEPRYLVANSPPSACFNAAQHVASFDVRTYNLPYNNEANWLATDGNKLGPTTTTLGDGLAPRSGTWCFFPNRWARVWMRIEQTANDWDYVTVWIADEQQNPVKVLDRREISTRPMTGTGTPRGIRQFYLEYETSTEPMVRTRGPNHVFVSYLRNFAVLKDAGLASAGVFSDAGMASYLVKPLP